MKAALNQEVLAAFFQSLYGPGSPYRLWAIALTICAVFCFPRGTRRAAGLAFILICAVMVISFYLMAAYIDFTPRPI